MIFTLKRREYLADKLGDLANIALGALVIGQFISETGFNFLVFLIGVCVGCVFYYLSLRFKNNH